jgi:hypothetical protein
VQFQAFPPERAYHGEVGRETTALVNAARRRAEAYHGEVGRETTAVQPARHHGELAYHGEVGRETTADQVDAFSDALAYHGEVGRETTARIQFPALRRQAYHGEVGRETTAISSPTGPRGRLTKMARRARLGKGHRKKPKYPETFVGSKRLSPAERSLIETDCPARPLL